MRLLFLTPRSPRPPLKGDQVVAYHRLRLLARRHEVALLTFYEDEREREELRGLEGLCEVRAVQLSRRRAVARMALGGATSRVPFQVLYYRSAAYRRALAELLAERPFDLADVVLLRLAPYGRLLGDLPRVLDLIDSMQLSFSRRVALERPPARWAFAEELRRVTAWERRVAGEFDHLLVVAGRDRELIPAENVTVVPNGIDTDAFAPRPELRRPETVVFSGNMRFPPNVSAAVWFAERCLPLLRARRPEARFVVAGAEPAGAVRALGRLDGVEVTGFVESMPAALNAASVAVAPMRSASGIQNKLLEAMACGLPCVTTRMGLGDVAAREGEELLVADEPEPFAEAVASLLADGERAGRIGTAGRGFVERRHSWEAAAAAVEAVYERVLAARNAAIRSS